MIDSFLFEFLGYMVQLLVIGALIALLGAALSYFFERRVPVSRHRVWLFLLGVLLVVGAAFKLSDYNGLQGVIALVLFVGGFGGQWFWERVKAYPGNYPTTPVPHQRRVQRLP